MAKKILQVYVDFFKYVLCIPVLSGAKTVGERFAGAVETYTVEA
jgi:prolyl-tRNA synthetase